MKKLDGGQLTAADWAMLRAGQNQQHSNQVGKNGRALRFLFLISIDKLYPDRQCISSSQYN